MTHHDRQMIELTRNLKTKSAKIRELAKAGFARADIARFLDIRYQHVRKVLVDEEMKLSAAQREAGADRPGSDLRSIKVRLGPDGRVVVPASVREKVGLKEGDVLFVRVENGEIHFLTPSAAAGRAQRLVQGLVSKGTSLVADLFAERRREVSRDQKHG